MNVLTKKDIMVVIRENLKTKDLKDNTLKNLINDCQLKHDDFYMGLNLLAKENKIIFLVTPAETYVLPLGKNNQSS